MKLVPLLFGVAACATAKPTPAPAIKAPLDSLAFYVGEWTCKGTTFATKDQKAEQWDARMVVAPELDGSWLHVQMLGPGMNRTDEHKGYDPVAKKWMHLAVGVEGSWGVVTSAGWTGQQMIFEDPNEHTVSTFTHLDDRHYTHAVASETGERLWQKVCTKV